MESQLQKRMNEYEKLLRKKIRLSKSLEKLSGESKVKAEVKMDKLNYQVSRAELIYLGKKMEKAGRDLASAVAATPEIKGDAQDIISFNNSAPKTQRTLKPSFKIIKTLKETLEDQWKRALKKIVETYKEIVPYDSDEDGDEDLEKPTTPDPLLPELTIYPDDDDKDKEFENNKLVKVTFLS